MGDTVLIDSGRLSTSTSSHQNKAISASSHLRQISLPIGLWSDWQQKTGYIHRFALKDSLHTRSSQGIEGYIQDLLEKQDKPLPKWKDPSRKIGSINDYYAALGSSWYDLRSYRDFLREQEYSAGSDEKVICLIEGGLKSFYKYRDHLLSLAPEFGELGHLLLTGYQWQKPDIPLGSRLADWKAGKNVNLYGCHETYLRVAEDGLETSKGIRLTRIEAKVLFRAFQKQEVPSGTFAGHYKIESVSPQGIRSGCHFVPASEIEWAGQQLSL